MYRKLRWLGKALSQQFDSDRFCCTNCGSTNFTEVDRKYIVTALKRCNDCQLLFRTPTDSLEHNVKFYNQSYTQGFTTDVPDDQTLAHLTETSFAGTEKDFSYRIDVLEAFGVKPGAKLFDFGCSWGYGSWQFRQHGYAVTAYEISEPRRRFAAEKLGVQTVDSVDDIGHLPQYAETFDCFFSSHVLEHVPQPSRAFALAFELLKPGGVFVSFTPNGSEACREADPSWSRLWGEVHPNFIDDTFFKTHFARSRGILTSSPLRQPEGGLTLERMQGIEPIGDLSGTELLFVAQKPEAARGWR